MRLGGLDWRTVRSAFVLSLPTLVVVGEDGFEKYRGVSDIKGWLMHRRAS